MSQAVGGKDLSRSYLVEGCQTSLDSLWDIQRSPGKAPGAELSFKQLLKFATSETWKIFKVIHKLFQAMRLLAKETIKDFKPFLSLSKISLLA